MFEADSDKVFWHRYVDVYERALAQTANVTSILEYGVFRGASIRWLAQRFPEAGIVGVDIMPPTAEWPTADRITYLQLDQGDRAGIAGALARLGRQFDLVIEDGSHIPQHQAICLTETFPYVRSGGLYILEDIHSSHRENGLFKQYQAGDLAKSPNALNVLLGLQHAFDRRHPLDDRLLAKLGDGAFFSREEVRMLYNGIAGTELFKRTQLPLQCWVCRGDDFDYAALRCVCGHGLYENAESMSFLIRKA